MATISTSVFTESKYFKISLQNKKERYNSDIYLLWGFSELNYCQ